MRDPLARMIIDLSIFHKSGRKPYSKRMKYIIEEYHKDETTKYLRRLMDEPVKLDYESYKEIIIGLLEAKAREWDLHDSPFINTLDK